MSGKRPYTPEELKKRVAEITALFEQSEYTPDAKQMNYIRGQVAAGMDQVVSKEMRRDVLHAIIGAYSTKELSVPQLRALHLWLYPGAKGGMDPAPYVSKLQGGKGYEVYPQAENEMLMVRATLLPDLFDA